MHKHFLKYKKVFTNIAFSPLILISNNTELAAKDLTKDVSSSVKILTTNNLSNSLSQGLNTRKEKNIFIAENKENIKQESVLIAEIIIEGWENHPEVRKLELAAYDAMSIKPGSIVDNRILSQDLNAI